MQVPTQKASLAHLPGDISRLDAPQPLPASHHRDESLSNKLYIVAEGNVAATAKAHGGSAARSHAVLPRRQTLTLLYTAEERRRRDATRWTLVQGILAPIQFFAFAISVGLIARYLTTGEGLAAATISIVVKTTLLYAIMITGAIWEREVFGVYLFAPAFFWEDVFSFLVIGLHTAYLVMLIGGYGDARQQMMLALAAYAAYAINATQFLLKLRAARRDERLVAGMQGAAS